MLLSYFISDELCNFYFVRIYEKESAKNRVNERFVLVGFFSMFLVDYLVKLIEFTSLQLSFFESIGLHFVSEMFQLEVKYQVFTFAYYANFPMFIFLCLGYVGLKCCIL